MPKNEETEQDTFHDVISAIDANEVEPERHLSIQIDTALREAIRATQDSGQTAGVTIAVKVKRDGDRRVVFAANISKKLPTPTFGGATLYADAAGRVHRSDPAQIRMDFPKAVPITSKKES